MKQIENYETVQASTGEFARPTAGGYICKIVDVEDFPVDENGKGDYLRIEYDIAEGEFADYYREQFLRWGGNWFASFIRSYKEKALGMFKHFTNCVEKSNAGFAWDWNEKELIGKQIGLVLGEEEYKNSGGQIKTKLTVKQIKTVEEIRNGDFKIPAIKKLTVTESQVPEFTDSLDDDIPFV